MSDRNYESDESSEDITFDELFESFCKVGDRNAEDIALRNIDKWFRQANIFSKEITPTDTAILFSKISKMGKKKITIDQFREMLDQLAEEKDIEVSELESQLESAGKPSYSGVTKPIRGSIAARNMERLTDPLQYTGSSKERFDESGKGLGLAGRFDVATNDGYVQGYKRSGEDLDKPQNKAEKKKSREEQTMNQAERRKSREEQTMNQAERRKSREEQTMNQAERRKSREEQAMNQAERRKSREEQTMNQAERRKSREEQQMSVAGKRRSREEQPMREAGKRRSREEQPIREAGKRKSSERQHMRGKGHQTREEQPMREDYSEEDSE